jgi:hypothetical protein
MRPAHRTREPKPLGQPTRGKTAPNRLRKTDTFLGVAFPDFVRRMTGLYVDLGYGAYPVTSVETLRRLRRLNPSLRALGVEIDPQRVAEAQPFAEPRLEFHLGGFNLPLQPDESVSVLRAFNVLRQYDEAAVAKALAALSAPLIEGGLILEGTSDPLGRLLTFNLFQKQKGDLERIAFVLAPPCAPTLRQAQGKLFSRAGFRRCCPRPLSITPGRAARLIVSSPRGSGRARGGDQRRVFAQSALRLADHYSYRAARCGYHVDRRPSLLRRGFLWLGPEWPQTRATRD